MHEGYLQPHRVMEGRATLRHLLDAQLSAPAVKGRQGLPVAATQQASPHLGTASCQQWVGGRACWSQLRSDCACTL